MITFFDLRSIMAYTCGCVCVVFTSASICHASRPFSFFFLFFSYHMLFWLIKLNLEVSLAYTVSLGGDQVSPHVYISLLAP